MLGLEPYEWRSNMKYFWYDHKAKGKQQPELVGFRDLATKFNASASNLPQDSMQNTCYFVHYEDGKKTQWENIARVDRKCFVVFVSSKPSSLQSAQDGVFCITDDLSEVANKLTNDKITLFTTTCSSGHPDWSVFQTKFFPEHLVAAYLLQIAKCKEVNVEMNDSFWSKASREFSQVLGEEKQSVELTLDNGQRELEKLFAELAKAKGKG